MVIKYAMPIVIRTALSILLMLFLAFKSSLVRVRVRVNHQKGQTNHSKLTTETNFEFTIPGFNDFFDPRPDEIEIHSNIFDDLFG